jgi:hypothetical protein
MKAQQEMEQAEKREEEKARLRLAASKANLAKVRKEIALTKDTVKEGYIYVQPSDSVTWKRRYFVLSKDVMKFYRDEKASWNVCKDFTYILFCLESEAPGTS